MSTVGPVKISVIAMTLLLAMPLLAQRYQGRDHHVFHPPVQAKHPSAPSAGSAAQTRVSSTGNPLAARSHEANATPAHSNDTSHPQMTPSTGTVHPH